MASTAARSQSVMVLTAPKPATPVLSSFLTETTRHTYRVVPLWEQDPAPLLANLSLLPLAALMATENATELLGQIATQVNAIESRQQRQEVSVYVQILAGLRFEQSLIRQLFQEDLMQESVIYQEIFWLRANPGRGVKRDRL